MAPYRESAAPPVRTEEEYSVLAYDEPWDGGHVFRWSFCLVWDVVVLAALVYEPWNPLILFCHLPLGIFTTINQLRWGRSQFTLVVSPSHLECDVWPFFKTWSWRVEREHIEDVLVHQRLYTNDGDWVEWTVSVRLRDRGTHLLFSRASHPDDPLPAGVDRVVTQLGYELMRPVTRETRDERKR